MWSSIYLHDCYEYNYLYVGSLNRAVSRRKCQIKVHREVIKTSNSELELRLRVVKLNATDLQMFCNFLIR
ncbi:hypothetical protein WN51_09139 [Melipona quadrifasciata]|uniref:Uncharacterized protein n=1 Tax=Melipona quadrifasciata TaxID=166423 RepID=A0A0M9A8E7_9HYME|nr:hypothetical protein WN51_09139 [Melipona quadrifasciata]